MKLKVYLSQHVAQWKSHCYDVEEGLHVIGTCGKCKFYKNDGNYSNCIFDDVYEPVGPAYGCIHWQKKQ